MVMARCHNRFERCCSYVLTTASILHFSCCLCECRWHALEISCAGCLRFRIYGLWIGKSVGKYMIAGIFGLLAGQHGEHACLDCRSFSSTNWVVCTSWILLALIQIWFDAPSAHLKLWSSANKNFIYKHLSAALLITFCACTLLCCGDGMLRKLILLRRLEESNVERSVHIRVITALIAFMFQLKCDDRNRNLASLSAQPIKYSTLRMLQRNRWTQLWFNELHGRFYKYHAAIIVAIRVLNWSKNVSFGNQSNRPACLTQSKSAWCCLSLTANNRNIRRRWRNQW